MKRIISTLLSLSMLCALLPAALTVHAEAVPAGTVIVDQTLSGTDGDVAEVTVNGTVYSTVIGVTSFAKVSSALDALPAGGTLILAPGTYSESVTIKKDITILGPKAGIDPSIRGASPTDDWVRNPLRGEGEATLTTSWHVGIYAAGGSKDVYDCHDVTVDGISVSGAGMFRSNLGVEGNIKLTYKNILVTGYTTNNNGPFYCYSYYPDKATNNYSRNLVAENIRFEGLTTAPGFNLCVDSMDASGIYFDSKSTGKMFAVLTMSTAAQSGVEVTYTVRDSMFRQKTNQVLNCNLTPGAGGHNFNANIANCSKVAVNITNNVFFDNDSAAAQNNNIIVPQIKTDNIYFNITDNIFYQSGSASANFIAIHGATDARALGEKFVIKNNRFINIPTALAMPNSTSEFDLSGNYFETAEKQPAKPVVQGKDKTEWWYIDYEMTKSSTEIAGVLDGVPSCGSVDKTAKTITDSVDTDEYKFTIDTQSYNEVSVYADKELKTALSNPVKLYSETSTFYVKISSANMENYEVYTATIKTSKPDTLSFDLASELRWFGRTYSIEGARFFNWSASGFEFKFKGSGVSATIASNAPGGNNTAYIKIYIDGVEQPDVALTKTSQTITLASGLDPNVEHTVKVVKRTNARSSSAALTSLKLTDGTKLAPPAAPERLIEFIGDSITVGYATVANGSTTWSTSTEDATKTYSEQIAKAFGADYMVTAISGRGIVRNTGGDTDKLLPAIYGNIDEYNNPGIAYDFARQPDVIIINLGTNDASGNNPNLTGEEFSAGLKAFLLDVRAKNPNAQIIYGYGMMTTKFMGDMKNVIKELNEAGDNKIAFTLLMTCASDERAIGHPTAEAYVSRGETLIAQIEKMTGWKAGEAPVIPDDTTAPEDTTAEPTPDVSAPETTVPAPETTETPDGGCGSAFAGAAITTAIAAGFVLAKKKKRK